MIQNSVELILIIRNYDTIWLCWMLFITNHKLCDFDILNRICECLSFFQLFLLLLDSGFNEQTLMPALSSQTTSVFLRCTKSKVYNISNLLTGMMKTISVDFYKNSLYLKLRQTKFLHINWLKTMTTILIIYFVRFHYLT